MHSGQDLKSLFSGIADTTDWGDVVVSGLTMDSRSVNHDELFLALPGRASDGRKYIGSALTAGAAAVVSQSPSGYGHCDRVFEVQGLDKYAGVVADRFYQQPSRQLCVVGITGTNGKTSCCHLLAQCLDSLGASSGILGTLGNGFLPDLDESQLTTQDVVNVHKGIRDLLDRGAEFICMEASSHALDQGRVNRVAFDVAIFTNLTPDHLDYHETMASYGQAKASLFEWPDLTASVINIDDPFGNELANSIISDKLWSYGRSDHARVRLSSLEVRVDGLVLQVDTEDEQIRLQVGLLGVFNAENVLAVFTTLLALGFSSSRAAQAVAGIQPIRGRMELVEVSGRPRIVVDYAHTPDALEKALISCRQQCAGKLWVVFGCGGDRDTDKRAAMGAIATRLSDQVVLTDDNPRHESSAQIIKAIQQGCHGKEMVISDRPAAIRQCIELAAAEDVILVAGKGHETYQIIGDQRFPMDDRQLACDALGDLH